MSKKIIAVLMAAILLVGGLAACGGKGGSSNFSIPEGGYDGSEVTIKFAHTMGQKLKEVLDYHIGEFNKLYPNIHIEHDSYGGWADIAGLINTEIMADNQPNIAYCYPDHVATYNMSQSVVTLDDLIASDIETARDDGTTEPLGLTKEQVDDFIDGFYNEGKAYGDDKMYTMPLSKSTEVLYYNKTFFEKNNLKVPTTWDEMEETCKKLLELDPKCIPLGYDSEDNWFITMCEQGGYDYTSATGEHYLFNNDDCKAFVKRFRDWYNKGYVTTEALYGGYTSGLFTELDKNTSHSYMCIGSSGGAGYQIPEGRAFEVGIASIPQLNPDDGKVISQGPSVCILKGGKTTDQQVLASWLFVKFLCTNVEFQAEFSMASGYMPVIDSVVNNSAYANWLGTANGKENLVAQCVKVGIDNRNDYFVSPAFKGSSTARVLVGNLLVKCKVDEAADEAAVDALIDQAFAEAIDECE